MGKFFGTKKKIGLIVLLSILVVFLVGWTVSAVTLDVGIDYGAQTGLGTQDIRVTIARIIRAFLGFLGIVALLVILYGGFLYMTAGGAAEKIDAAKKTLISAFIGLVIVLSAFSIAQFILSRLLEATGAGGGGACEVCSPDGITEFCGVDGAGCSNERACIGGCWSSCTKTDPTCPAPNPFAQCPNPSADANPWLCLVPPATGEYYPGDGLTVWGSNINLTPTTQDIYIQDTSGRRFDVEVVNCLAANNNWFTALPGGLSKIVIVIPESLTKINEPFRVIADFDSFSTSTKDWGATTRRDEFYLDGTTVSDNPILACILDGPGEDAQEIYTANTDETRYLRGRRFTNIGVNKAVSFDNVDSTILGWGSGETATVKVPLTRSGQVVLYAGVGHTKPSNPLWNDILCQQASAGTDCLGGCCIGSGANNVCAQTSFCAGGIDEPCFGGCTDLGCQPSLYCDTSQAPCTCQPIAVGAPCVCGDNASCGAPDLLYCSDTAGCLCQYLPQISAVVPGNGAPGNYVTIQGQGFGSYSPGVSKIYFVDDIASPPIEVQANLPTNCGAGPFWLDNEVVIEVPVVALQSYTIKLINNDSLEATWQYFDVNDTDRPSICAMVPYSGPAGATVQIQGKNFGTQADFNADPANYSVRIGGLEFNNKNNWAWQDDFIGFNPGKQPTVPLIELPNNLAADYQVQVSVGAENSNPRSFTVTPSPDQPVITSVEPAKGPADSYVTIRGRNFGTVSGGVSFNGWSAQSLPAVCSSFWHDDYIVVKVPPGTTISENIEIQVHKPGAGGVATWKGFNKCAENPVSCPLQPGICQIDPPQAPKDYHGVKIIGEYFGSYDSNVSQVTFSTAEALDAGVAWTNSQVGDGSTSLTVPIGAESGPVRLVRFDEVVSNTIDFNVADCRDEASDFCADPLICCQADGVCRLAEDCSSGIVTAQECTYAWSFTTGAADNTLGPPKVIKDILCEENTQSPSPWQATKANCLNTNISARFNQAMEGLTLSESNIILTACNTGDDFTGGCGSTAIGSDRIDYLRDGSNNIIGFIFYPNTPDNLLDANRWYQVTLLSGSSGIKSASGVWLDGDGNNIPGGNFSWYFRTDNVTEKCTLDKVVVNPPEATIELLTANQNYSALAMKDNCNILDGDDYNWDWYKKYSLDPLGSREDAGATNLNGVAVISLYDLEPIGNIDYQQEASPVKQGIAYVAAAAEGKADENNRLIVDLNIPKILEITPDNGLIHPDVNAYVTIIGENFGDQPTGSQALFETIPAELADCPNAWTDTMIQVKVPKGQPIQAGKNTTWQLPESQVQEGMLLYYDFEGNNDVLAQDKLGNYDAEIIDGLKDNDQFGKALYLNGSSAYAKVLDATNLNAESGSIEMWFKPAGDIKDSTLISIYNPDTNHNFFLDIIKQNNEEGNLGIYIEGTGPYPARSNRTTTAPIKKDQSHYIVYTWDNQLHEESLYINGQKFYFDGGDGNLSANTILLAQNDGFLADIANRNIILGANGGQEITDYFSGLMDNVAIYESVLTEQQVREHYGLRTGQVFLLNFDNFGSEIIDSSPNNLTNITVNDPSSNFRSEEGVTGGSLALNNNNYVIISNNPSLRFFDGLTIEGWIKDLNPGQDNAIFSSGSTRIVYNSSNSTIRFTSQFYAEDEVVTNYAQISTAGINWSTWNHFAAVYDGQKIKIYLNGMSDQVNNQYDVVGDIFNKNIGNAYVGYFPATGAGFSGKIDQLAVYNYALPEEEIFSRVGAKDKSFIYVKTPFGTASSDFNNNSIKDSGEVFRYSENVYPFLCSLTPFYGTQGTAVQAFGDNFGDSDKTVYNNISFGVGSFLRLDLFNSVDILDPNEITSWFNTLVDYINPISVEDFAYSAVPYFNVSISTDPYSDPYNDRDNDGQFTGCEPGMTPGVDCDDYADPESDGYDQGSYDTDGDTIADETALESNPLPFYLPPRITKISPDNGPIEQWVTIYGQNFGMDEGQVIFYNEVGAPLAPCDVNWTNDYILAVVPAEAVSGNVYVVTANEIRSINEVPFEVNDKPLGAGMCSIYNYQIFIDSLEAEVKDPSGRVNDYVVVEGDRFEEDPADADSQLLFFDNVPAEIEVPEGSTVPDAWTNQQIFAQIMFESQTGEVVVTKRIETGRECVGFQIRSWCPGGEEIVYEDIPSNSLPFRITEICNEGQLGKSNTRDDGFPISTWVYDSAGNKQDYTNINLGLTATDGTYIYGMAFYGTVSYDTWNGKFDISSTTDSNSDGVPDEDNTRTLWRIGSGYNGTELGRVYAKYQYDYTQAEPAQLRINPWTNSGWGKGASSFIGTADGSLYSGSLYWNNSPLYAQQQGKDYVHSWMVPRIKFISDGSFNETSRIYEGTYSYDWLAIPNGFITDGNADWPEYAERTPLSPRINFYSHHLASNGTYIYAVSADAPGAPINDRKAYTIQVMDQGFKEVDRFSVYAGSANYWSIVTDLHPIADSNYLWLNWDSSYTQVINLNTRDWQDFYASCRWYTAEYAGYYDWYHGKYWLGSSRFQLDGSPTNWTGACWYTAGTDNERNKIFRYSECLGGQAGFCRTDEDCDGSDRGLTCNSQCVNGLCTPDIQEFTPTSGPVGSVVTLRGCWFGCQPGNVYFQGPTAGMSSPTIKGNVVSYQFDNQEGGPGSYYAADSSGNNRNGVLYYGQNIPTAPPDGAEVENELLEFDNRTGYYNGEYMNIPMSDWPFTDKLTISVWIKPAMATGNFITRAQSDSWSIYIASATSLEAFINSYANNRLSVTTSNLLDGNWHLVVLTYDGSNTRLYVDGSLRGQKAKTGNITKSANIRVGIRNDLYSHYYRGLMDNFNIYNYVLSAQQIFDLANHVPGQIINNDVCGDGWVCGTDDFVLDEVKVRVPNDQTQPNMDCPTGNCPPAGYDINDAIDGPILLKTANGQSAWTTSFDVNANFNQPNILCLLPNEGKRGTTFRIHGENLQSTNIDSVIVQPTATTAREPWINQFPAPGPSPVPEPFKYQLGEKFVDFYGGTDNVWDESLLKDNFIFNIGSSRYVADLAGCPAGGQSGTDICVKVPKDGSGLASQTGINQDAGGYGTGQGKANNYVQVVQASSGIFSNAALYNVTFGRCGDNVRDLDTQEACDGTDIQVTEADRQDACLELFPGKCSDAVTGQGIAIYNQTDCENSGQIWTSNDLDDVKNNCEAVCDDFCDVQFCYQGVCLYLDSLCGNGAVNSFPSAGYTEDCDCGSNSQDCELFGMPCPAGQYGNLSCTRCVYNDEDCADGPPNEFMVQSTWPRHGEEEFCRNGLIDIYFDQLIDLNTVGYLNESNVGVRNVKLWTCTEEIVETDKPGLLASVAKYFKNILYKLIGKDRQALAQTDCLDPANWTELSFDLYSYEAVNVNNKTVLSVVPEYLLQPGSYYGIEIGGGLDGVRSISGGVLDNSNSPINPATVGFPADDYLFAIKTMGESNDPQSGICDVSWIDVSVYRQQYTDFDLASRFAEYRQDDLFICAGKDDCQLKADYDQDSVTSGNQHIYKARAKYDKGFSLKATYQWSRSDLFDRDRVIQIFNNFNYCESGDPLYLGQPCAGNDDCVADPTTSSGICAEQKICTAGEADFIGEACSDDTACGTGGECNTISDYSRDPNIVKNTSGYVLTTALPIEQSLAKLVIEAQAEGSYAAPAQQDFLVYVLLCSNPWPSLEEKFPIDSLINAYNFELYYCRDAGRPEDTTDDLPAAKWLFPDVTSLNVLPNTDFEYGNLTSWIPVGGNTAFIAQPVYSDITRVRDLVSSQIQGDWWVSTRENYHGYDWENITASGIGDVATGIMHSQAFSIEGDILRFKIGGGLNAWPMTETGILNLGSTSPDPIDGVTAVILAVKANPDDPFTVVAQATGNNQTSMTDKEFDTSAYISGRTCADDADCNGWGSCKDLEGAECVVASGEACQCTGVTGIIYLYDNNTASYLNFDDLRQYRDGTQIPIRF